MQKHMRTAEYCNAGRIFRWIFSERLCNDNTAKKKQQQKTYWLDADVSRVRVIQLAKTQPCVCARLPLAYAVWQQCTRFDQDLAGVIVGEGGSMQFKVVAQTEQGLRGGIVVKIKRR